MYLLLLIYSFAWAQPEATINAATPQSAAISINEACKSDLLRVPGIKPGEDLDRVCSLMSQVDQCKSEQGRPIYHYNRAGKSDKGRRILAMSLIHGDELPSGLVAKSWIERLEKIEPRNAWRVIPVANPDGLVAKTRTNSRGVDLNRNFPTKEWESTALKIWKERTKSDPRRYPGPHSASEVETKCLIQHLEDFKPDFIISIHTPIGVLDFDGPPVKVPKGSPLPWNPLGNFPGSLGRYMWKDKNIPVLTIELKGNSGVAKLEELDHLQDISGSIAIEANGRKN